MISTDYQQILTLVAVAVLLLTAGYAIRCRRRYRGLARRHNVISRERQALESECSALRERVAQQAGFAADLSQAELATKLQMSRLGHQGHAVSGRTPERYQYLAALSESGMEPEQIGALLSISTREAEQLVNLSRLSGTENRESGPAGGSSDRYR